jgi:hypothetical protein
MDNGTVKTRMFYARKRLSALLTRNGHNAPSCFDPNQIENSDAMLGGDRQAPCVEQVVVAPVVA